MDTPIRIRHVVSIAGVVRETVVPTNQKEAARIADALVRIVVPEAPAMFQARVSAMLDAWYANSFDIASDSFATELDASQLSDALRAQFEAHGKVLSKKKDEEPEERRAYIVPIEMGSTWQVVDAGVSYVIWQLNGRLTVYFSLRPQAGMASGRLRQRIDQTRTQADGIFYFINLPPGPYRLRVSAPEMGSRYGVEEIGPVDVQAAPEAGPFPVARADADLPPTRIHGVVTAASTGRPVLAARVRLLGDTTILRTGEDGRYTLTRLVAGKPTIEVTAADFKRSTRKIELAAGQDRQEDFALDK
jgi:hypothetical protein